MALAMQHGARAPPHEVGVAMAVPALALAAADQAAMDVGIGLLLLVAAGGYSGAQLFASASRPACLRHVALHMTACGGQSILACCLCPIPWAGLFLLLNLHNVGSLQAFQT